MEKRHNVNYKGEDNLSYKFQVVIPEYDQHGFVEAYDEEDALSDFCEESDKSDGDMTYARNDGAKGWVRAYPDGEWKEVECSIRPVPEYEASVSPRQRTKDNPEFWKDHYCGVCFERNHEKEKSVCKGAPASWGPDKEMLEKIEEE